MENKTKDFYNNLQNENNPQATEKKNVTKVEIKNEKKSLTIAVWLFLFVCLVMSIVSIVLIDKAMKMEDDKQYRIEEEIDSFKSKIYKYVDIETNSSCYKTFSDVDIYYMDSANTTAVISDINIDVFKDYVKVYKVNLGHYNTTTLKYIPIENVLYWE